MTRTKAIIFTGGTINKVRPHLAISAPAYGTVGRRMDHLLLTRGFETMLIPTRMAHPQSPIETSADLRKAVLEVVADETTKVVVMAAAVADFTLDLDHSVPRGRLPSDQPHAGILRPAPKILGEIRKERKDIFLVAFKTTCGASEVQQFEAGLRLMKRNSCNLVLANDVETRRNMIITPEEAMYHSGFDRDGTLRELANMITSRSELRFTRSEVVQGERVAWGAAPSSLRMVVEHCVAQGAYKPFDGKTVGHFAYRGEGGSIITSIRRSNFNELAQTGMVRIEAQDDDRVLAYGAKPSVGGQSQRTIFKEHPQDYIVHFHVPPRVGAFVPSTPQWPYECGSHECGASTSRNLVTVAPGIKAVYLENHGPNVVFGRDVDPADVIRWIDDHFDLSQSTRPIG